MTAELVKPSMQYSASYIEALKEGYVFGGGTASTAEEIRAIETNIEDHIAKQNRKGGRIMCPDGIERERVPSDTLWLVEDGAFIGAVSFRHELNDFLKRWGGHIGYGIRPSKQNRGYATLLLKLTLDRARQMGLDRVMISASVDNIASWRVIEKNGGVLEKTVKVEWEEGETRIYWISL